MSQAGEQDINFWPAYVDALINVVLNLLFLAGVFTIGLVVLNIEALNAEKQAAALEVKELLAGESPSQRQKKAQALLKDMMPPQSNTLPTVEANTGGPTLTEIRISRGDAAATQNNADVQLASAPELLQANALAQTATGGRVVLRVVFELGKYTPPERWSHNASAAFAPHKKYVLLAIADPSNPRLAREAFARLMSLRGAMQHMGMAETQMEILITPAQEGMQAHNDIERSVFVMELTK